MAEHVYLKVLGERNSGTNYADELLALNFEVVLLRGTIPRYLNRIFFQSEIGRDAYFGITERFNLGWKHALAPSPELLQRASCQPHFVSVAKNPYAWLLSMYRRPYHGMHAPASFDEFLVTPWPTVRRERHPGPFASPIEMWNEKNKSYIDLSRYASSLAFSYESFLEEPMELLEQIKEKFGLSRRLLAFKNIEKATKGDSRSFDYYKDYYLNQRWLEKLRRSNVDAISAKVDPRVMAYFGYEIL